MNQKKLSSYLSQIRSESPINISGFRRLLPKEIKESIHSHFDITPIDGKKAILRPLSQGVMDQLQELCIMPENRIEAAKLKDSHKVGVSKAYLLAYTDISKSDHPQTIILSEDRVTLNFTPKNTVLLIENEENFFHYEAMLRIASSFLKTPELSIETADVVLAGGNRVNKSSILNWINSTYSKVICAFDYDLGGLRMFDTLSNTVTHAQFLMPDNLDEYKDCFVNDPITSFRLRKAEALAERHKLVSLSQYFSKTRHFMEQEMLLIEDKHYGI